MTDKEKGLSKIILQIIFIVVLLAMFTVDKILHIVAPPLQDTWYLITMVFAVGIDPVLIINLFRKGQ